MKLFWAVFLACFGPAIALAEEPIRLMTEEFAPYQFYDGNGGAKSLTGISIEIVRQLQAKVGNRSEIEVMPWSRGLKLLRKYKNAALFSTARTPERESQYKWVGPLAKLEMVFFKKKGADIRLASMDEARKLPSIGVTKNVATHEILTAQGFENLDVLQSGADEKNLQRLIKGRVAVWPTGYYAGIYSAKKLNVLDRIEAVEGVKIMSGHLYIAFNKGTDDALIETWQAALDKLRKDGTVERILQTYDR